MRGSRNCMYEGKLNAYRVCGITKLISFMRNRKEKNHLCKFQKTDHHRQTVILFENFLGL